jgi:FkbM family methyltransferase
MGDHQPEFVTRGAEYLSALERRAGVSVRSSGDALAIDVNGLAFIAQSEEDLFILKEIFVEQVYSFRVSRPAVVWDVGMNVGYASLAFASRDDVIAVRGYEPFRDNYDAALIHLKMNTEVAKKVRAVNMAIGASGGVRSAFFSPRWRGQSGFDRLSPDLPQACLRTECVGVRAASDSVRELVYEYPGIPLVAKLDCEGAEYEIVTALSAAGVLPLVSVFMIEWHARGPDPLIDLLSGAGFTCFAPTQGGETTGMVYASR